MKQKKFLIIFRAIIWNWGASCNDCQKLLQSAKLQLLSFRDKLVRRTSLSRIANCRKVSGEAALCGN